MPLTEKQKTAFHEAGHCFRAWRAHFLAVHDTCICEEPAGEWWGKTEIYRPAFTQAQRTEIALAGILAEAKAVASDGAEVQQVANSAALTSAIAQLFVDHNIPVAGPGVVIENDAPFPIAVPMAQAEPVIANVTLSDLAEIPADHRDGQHIGEALNQLAGFLNNPTNWIAIQAIGNALIFVTGCLGNFPIYGIIRSATDPFFPKES